MNNRLFLCSLNWRHVITPANQEGQHLMDAYRLPGEPDEKTMEKQQYIITRRYQPLYGVPTSTSVLG